MNKVLVLMTTYNESLEHLSEAINSLKEQTYTNFDVIIIVDKPDVDEIIKSYLLNLASLDGRFNIHINKFNLGLANSLNLAFDIMKDKDYAYIARMDADDISVPNRFKEQVKYLDNAKDADLIGTSAITINEQSDVTGEFNVKLGSVDLDYGSDSIHPSWMMRFYIFSRLSGYRDFRCSQDYDFLCRAKLAGFKIKNINEKLLYYRIRPNSIGASKKLIQRRRKYHISKNYRGGNLLNVVEPVLNENIMTRLFEYIEANKKQSRIKYILMIFSLYHVRNFYLLFKKRSKK
ncbi:glycosyltransferase [Vibrio sp. Makdt]|uniref:glycosyltransferase n=1 Tax=Vibrio sp. Makdt TaxID=2998828 RepID=UPI0022CD7F84|nr:glycosyltransferase [Vibrio sp. Makdt]MDA0155589.1 glycosyltransferase [Vibrio sp. Makdt]